LVADSACVQAVLAGLNDPFPSVRVAAAEACVAMGCREAAPVLRTILSRESSESLAELAYALGSLGDEGDAELIIQVAAKLNSPAGRRRALLGAAKLFGVESEFYRLIMLDSVSRDQAIMEAAKPGRARGIRGAVALYHAMDEEGALRRLAERNADPRLKSLAAYAPREGFLLAICLISRGLRNES
jgi:hypothetical protein